MKYFRLLIFLALFTNCQSSKSDETKIQAKSDEVREFAEFVLQGNRITLEKAYLRDKIFDSLNSPIATSRKYYSNVSKYLLKRGDGYLSRILGTNLLAYIKSRPKEFLNEFSSSDSLTTKFTGETIGAFYFNEKLKGDNELAKIDSLLSTNSKDQTEQSYSKKLLYFARAAYKSLSHGG